MVLNVRFSMHGSLRFSMYSAQVAVLKVRCSGCGAQVAELMLRFSSSGSQGTVLKLRCSSYGALVGFRRVTCSSCGAQFVSTFYDVNGSGEPVGCSSMCDILRGEWLSRSMSNTHTVPLTGLSNNIVTADSGSYSSSK